jgi:ABC-type antimicrobial peptide transport system permease subunit
MSALDALRLHKLRSALTMLGIIIGVAASITVSSFDARAGTQRRSRSSHARGDRRTATMLIENLIPVVLVSAIIFGVLWLVREAGWLRDDGRR